MSKIGNIWKPEVYHGHRVRPTFFEGWYFKMISADQRHRLAVIPGIYHHPDPAQSHAFVQTLNGMTGESAFHRYPVKDFRAETDEFDVYIGPNHFRGDRFSLELDGEGERITGEVAFEGGRSWPVSAFSPGIMGPFTFVPLMQCYHGVLSFDHRISGVLAVNGKNADFSEGRGYIEKDWGKGFPRAYIWMQSNHFADSPGTCLTASIATIPWIASWFRGFIVGLWHREKLYRFTTYTGGQVGFLSVTDTHVEWRLRGSASTEHGRPEHDYYTIDILAERAEGGVLKAPEPTGMIERVVESLTASVTVTLAGYTRGRRQQIFHGTGACSGLEVSGSIEEIIDG